jgi:tetratricopeptide (TPR) repeat protein
MTAMRRVFLYGLSSILLNVACGPDDVHKGNIALELGDYPLAIKLFSRRIENNPADFDARLGIGKACLQKAFDNRDDTVSWREALMHLEAAHTIRGSPEITGLLAQVWVERGSSLLYAQDTLQALEALSRAIAVDQQSHDALNLAGIVYYKTGKPEKARLLFERAVRSDSTNTSSVFNLGMLYWEEHKVGKARDMWLRALTNSPHDEDLLYWFAAAEKNLRDSASADARSGESLK